MDPTIYLNLALLALLSGLLTATGNAIKGGMGLHGEQLPIILMVLGIIISGGYTAFTTPELAGTLPWRNQLAIGLFSGWGAGLSASKLYDFAKPYLTGQRATPGLDSGPSARASPRYPAND